jgi:hypothetical protein
MKKLVVVGLLAAGFMFTFGTTPSSAGVLTLMPEIKGAVVEHGGGCRKAHLPQCCHMDNSVGSVHCH